MLSLTSSRISVRLSTVRLHQRLAGSVTNITDADWDPVVLQGSSKKVVLVDFTAKYERLILELTRLRWCNPCQLLTPTLEKLAKQEDITLAKYDIDESSEMAETYGVSSIPAVYAFGELIQFVILTFVSANGRAIAKFVGALHESEVQRFIQDAKQQATEKSKE